MSNKTNPNNPKIYKVFFKSLPMPIDVRIEMLKEEGGHEEEIESLERFLNPTDEEREQLAKEMEELKEWDEWMERGCPSA